MTATILIADDYEDNLELLRLLLAAAGYNVKEARNGQECLSVAQAQRPDLIMIDLSMPILDGWEVFRQLKADGITAGIPCVAVTAYGETDRDHALKTGFDGYLSKPFRGVELLETVARLLLTSQAKPAPVENLAQPAALSEPEASVDPSALK